MGKLKRSESSKAYFTRYTNTNAYSSHKKTKLKKHLAKHPTDNQAVISLEKGQIKKFRPKHA